MYPPEDGWERTQVFLDTANAGLRDAGLKADIVSDINALDKKFGGVLVIAEGRHQDNQRMRNVQVIGQEGHF